MSDAADLVHIHAYFDTSLPPALWTREAPAPKSKRIRSAVSTAAEVEVTEVEVEPS